MSNLIIIYTLPPLAPTIFNLRYLLSTLTTGGVVFEASISESFGTSVSYFGKVISGSSSVEVNGNTIFVSRVPYIESQTISVVATSAQSVCAENSSSSDVTISFTLESKWCMLL